MDVCAGLYQSFNNLAGISLVERSFTLVILMVDISASMNQRFDVCRSVLSVQRGRRSMHRYTATFVFSVDLRTGLEQYFDHVFVTMWSGQMNWRPSIVVRTMYLRAASE
jgi:hypothetical protein